MLSSLIEEGWLEYVEISLTDKDVFFLFISEASFLCIHACENIVPF